MGAKICVLGYGLGGVIQGLWLICGSAYCGSGVMFMVVFSFGLVFGSWAVVQWVWAYLLLGRQAHRIATYGELQRIKERGERSPQRKRREFALGSGKDEMKEDKEALKGSAESSHWVQVGFGWNGALALKRKKDVDKAQGNLEADIEPKVCICIRTEPSANPGQRTLNLVPRLKCHWKLSLLDTVVMGDTMINVVYKNANAPIEARIKDLMSRMSVKEKLGQMTQIERAVATPDVIRDLCIGSVLSGGGSKPFEKATSADWADMVDGLQKGALESRLGIPMFIRQDPDLVERIGAATALETRASGVQYAFAPCVAVCRDPRWGRCYEGYSEDTELVRKMTSLVTGLQGTPPPDHPSGYPYVAGRSAVLSAVNAGVDMVMVPFRYQLFLEDLGYLVESGEVPMSRIDDAVERILRVKFAAGLFEYPMADRSLLDIVGCKRFLPLDRNAKRVLVAGKHADDLGYQCGGWTATWDGTSGRITTVVGEAPYVESGGDNSELTIPFNGNELLKLVADKIPTLGILISGRPLVLEPSVLETLDALVAAWLPGTEGNGITDVIFGDYEFHGRLPVSWFKTVDQLPMNTHQDSYDPLFPLGYGLKSKA
ncbi:lysosomal beta glucosidase [Tanacetum coccineum]